MARVALFPHKVERSNLASYPHNGVWCVQVYQLDFLQYALDLVVLPLIVLIICIVLLRSLLLLCAFQTPRLLLFHFLFRPDAEDLDRAVVRLDGEEWVRRMESDLRDFVTGSDG